MIFKMAYQMISDNRYERGTITSALLSAISC